ncbi:MAG TPA: tripartite tricarboxylate transporter substrate binding protein [Acetobacteraceae bacterium]|nr:tripartite tricarboxylate transporter substrate binding protein [Acetobacteraceae bacterium]
MWSRRLALGLVAAPLVARAQGNWPDRPVRIVVPYSAGGVADTTARIMQPKLAEHLGQSVIVENRTGASGSIAAAAVAQSPSDGYTLLYEGSTYITLPLVNRSLPVDYEAALSPVGISNSQPYIIGIRAGFPARDFAGLMEEARRRPGLVTYGTPGVAHIGHFMGELIQLMGNVRMEHIPFRGGADVARELAAERIDVGIISFSSLRPAVARGARLIGSTAPQRSPTMPEIPAIAETLPGYELMAWTGFFAPAATPQGPRTRFLEALRQTLEDPGIRQRMIEIGNDPLFGDGAEMAATIRRGRETLRRIMQSANITLG